MNRRTGSILQDPSGNRQGVQKGILTFVVMEGTCRMVGGEITTPSRFSRITEELLKL